MNRPLQELFDLIFMQSEDDGLWAKPVNIVEAYTQQELRRLHAAVERLPEFSDYEKQKIAKGEIR